MDIKALIDKAIAGDEQAFEELYNVSYKRAYIKAQSFMKDEDKIAEVLQLAYIRVYNNLDKVDNPNAFNAWVNRIVENTCKNELKKRKEFSFSDEQTNEDMPIEIEDEHKEFQPNENIKYEDDREVVMGFINELSTEQRAALVMQIYEDKKISEVADFFETSESTIKSRLNYAKKTIRLKVEAYKKAGNTLFVLPLIPYLKGILNSYEETISVDSKLCTRIVTTVTESSAPEGVSNKPMNHELSDETKRIFHETTKETGKHTLKGISTVIGGSTVAKVVIGVVIVAVVIGEATSLNNSSDTTNDTTSTMNNQSYEETKNDSDSPYEIANALGYSPQKYSNYYGTYKKDDSVSLTDTGVDSGYTNVLLKDLDNDSVDELMVVIPSSGYGDYGDNIRIVIEVYENKENEWIKADSIDCDFDVFGCGERINVFMHDDNIFFEYYRDTNFYTEVLSLSKNQLDDQEWFLKVYQYKDEQFVVSDNIDDLKDVSWSKDNLLENTNTSQKLLESYHMNVDTIGYYSIMSQDDSVYKLCQIIVEFKESTSRLKYLYENAESGSTFGTIETSFTNHYFDYTDWESIIIYDKANVYTSTQQETMLSQGEDMIDDFNSIIFNYDVNTEDYTDKLMSFFNNEESWSAFSYNNVYNSWSKNDVTCEYYSFEPYIMYMYDEDPQRIEIYGITQIDYKDDNYNLEDVLVDTDVVLIKSDDEWKVSSIEYSKIYESESFKVYKCDENPYEDPVIKYSGTVVGTF
ncbi:MAG: RNA polymerase sigma factor [Erysipelotrichaceae bacterium]|nr:RNA polymerase sigma factor [Erysipelotrichaceae bacterium]